MREKTTIADKYLLEHFYQTCSGENKVEMACNGVELDDDYSWFNVVLSGERICRDCKHRCERLGMYFGKGEYSDNFENQEFVNIRNIRTQEEFEAVCERINANTRGIVIDAAVSDASALERFEKLEFVVLEGHRLSHFWNTAKNPKLSMITVWMNKHLKRLNGLENAENLECLQFYSTSSNIGTYRIETFEPISKLKKLKELILSATGPLDDNSDYLISIPTLEYLWISPNVYPMECYAKFEAKRFKIFDEYGIYCEEYGDIFPYGKGKRIMHTEEQKERYLRSYNELLKKYK